MPELRKHYFMDDYVIIATERGKRPSDFKHEERKITPKEKCPFCPENEHMVPKVLEEVRNDNTWETRAIENKFGYVGNNAPFIRTDNEFYTFGNAYGSNEVIVDTTHHGEELEELSEERIRKVLKLIVMRINKGYEKKGVEYVSIFKNRGNEAGASLSHSHHQMISLNLFPTEIRKEAETVRKYKQDKGICPMCRVILSEKDSDRRIYQDESVVAFAPYASRFCFEAWVMPRRCAYSITELSDAELDSLAKVLKKTLMTLDNLNYPAYNLFYKMGNKENHDFHFRIEIAPRLSKWAGFEYVTGTIINAVTPENAAKFYRGEQ